MNFEILSGKPMISTRATGRRLSFRDCRFRQCKSVVCLISGLLVVILASADRFAEAQVPESPQPKTTAGQVIKKSALAPGKLIEAEIAGNESHVYELALTAGQFLHAIVEERGVDLIVTLYGPDGEKLIGVDLFSMFAPEPVSYEAQRTGLHRLEVRLVTAERLGGQYQITSEVRSSPTAQDKGRMRAEKLLIDASEVWRASSKISWRQAIAKYEESLPLWHELADQFWEGYALAAIGYSYLFLEERQKALEFYERSLALRKSIHDQTGIANSLYNLGRVYGGLGEKQKALDSFDQALAFIRQRGSPAYELDMLTKIGGRLLSLKEPQKALDLLNQALSLEKSLNDRSGETWTLLDIGRSHKELGEKKKALEILLAALDGQRAGYQRWNEVTTLYNIAEIYRDFHEPPKVIEYYLEALPLLKEEKNPKEESVLLTVVGNLYAETGEKRKGIEYFSLALSVSRATGDREGEAEALRHLGSVHESLSEYPKALEAGNQWLAVSRSVGNRDGEARALVLLGVVYSIQGEARKAQDTLEQALAIFRSLGDRAAEAGTLVSLGGVYSTRGQSQKGLELLNTALSIFKSLGDIQQQESTLQILSYFYGDLGDKRKAEEASAQAALLQKGGGDTRLDAIRMMMLGGASYINEDPQKALSSLNQALQMSRATGDRNVEGVVQNVIGGLYVRLGEYDKALEALNQSLQLCKAVGNRVVETEAFANIGMCYYELKMYPKALDHLRQGLAVIREIGIPGDEAALLGNIGAVYDKQGQLKTAIEYFKQALVISRKIGDRNSEGRMLTAIGDADRKLGEPRKSLKLHTQALAIFREVGSLRGEAGTFNNLMELWRDRKKPRLAILYGKLAVNVYQQTRRNIRELEKGLQASYLKTIEDTYRQLADLLVSDGRLPEAQQVLGLLKEEEYFAFVRRDPTALSLLNRSDLTQEEAAAIKRYDENAGVISKLAQEFEALRKQGTSHDNPRYQELKASLEAANRTFQVLLRQLEDEFGKASVKRDLSESGGLRADLQEWGKGTVALYTLVGEKNYRVILTTPNLQVAREANPKITAVELNKLVLDFREAVQNPNIDPRPLGLKLYNVLIGPIAKDLEAAGAKTLVWSLDGTLRYVPLAALHDGRQYMAERFQNVVITPASHTRLNDVPTSEWHGLGLGVSKGLVKEWGTFIPLPSVPDELRGIIREDANSQSALGVMPGRVMLDETFTEKAMEEALEGGRYPLVHIASHFAFKPGNEADSFLLLGNGDRLTLDKINMTAGGKFFYKVELLTLSACDTATGGNANGKEVEGFAVLAQRQGAQAVLATLWPVADNSTQQLMEHFYRFRVTDHLSKAESLRRAQMTLFNGNVEVDKNGPLNPGTAVLKDLKPRFIADPAARFAHPYYWAPFILIGNWR